MCEEQSRDRQHNFINAALGETLREGEMQKTGESNKM